MSAGYAQRLSEYPNKVRSELLSRVDFFFRHLFLIVLFTFKGKCGLPENHDSQRAFVFKVNKLSQLIQQSEYTVVLTGAGISTSAGIPDFRGPFGIWTREQRERKRNKAENKKKQKKTTQSPNNEKLVECLERERKFASPLQEQYIGRTQEQSSDLQEDINDIKQTFISFEAALPTYTHRALTHLIVQPPTPPDESNNDNRDSSNDNCRNRTYIHHIVTQNVDGLHRKTNLPRNKMSVLHGCSKFIHHTQFILLFNPSALPCHLIYLF